MQPYAVSPETDVYNLPVPTGQVGRTEVRLRTQDLIASLDGASHATRSAIRAEVVTLHLWLAVVAARRFGSGNEHDDLAQVARMGLVEAFDRFDPEQGSYANFAWLTMTGLLRRHLRDHGWSVRPPRSLQESANTLRKVRPDLTQELGRTPTTADLAAHLGWSPGAVRDAQLADQGLCAVSVEALVGDSWIPKHPGQEDSIETRLLLRRALQRLTEDERQLLRLRFLDNCTQAQIGAALATNQMNVSRRLTRLMLKLRGLIGELDGDSNRPQAKAAAISRARRAEGTLDRRPSGRAATEIRA